jgi:hypothetical protein
MAARRSTKGGDVKTGKRVVKKPKAEVDLAVIQEAANNPCGVVGGFILALDEVIAKAPAGARAHLRVHAMDGLRRASEKYRMDLLSSGLVDASLLDGGLATSVEEVRRNYLISTAGGTQPMPSVAA